MSANGKGGSVMILGCKRQRSMLGGFPSEFLPGYVPCNVIPSQCRSCVSVASQEHLEIVTCRGSCPKDLASG